MKKILLMIVAFALIFFSNTKNIYASSKSDIVKDPKQVTISSNIDGQLLEGATLTKEIFKMSTTTKTTIKIYRLSDGNTLTDTLVVDSKPHNNRVASASGTDTATRTLKITNWGTITIKAAFKWYTKYSFPQTSYVKCTSMSASKTISSKAVCSTWETSYNSEYVTIGKASAKVKYYFYNPKNPTEHMSGTYGIYCSDSGTISDK